MPLRRCRCCCRCPCRQAGVWWGMRPPRRQQPAGCMALLPPLCRAASQHAGQNAHHACTQGRGEPKQHKQGTICGLDCLARAAVASQQRPARLQQPHTQPRTATWGCVPACCTARATAARRRLALQRSCTRAAAQRNLGSARQQWQQLGTAHSQAAHPPEGSKQARAISWMPMTSASVSAFLQFRFRQA